jgi:hypothetical protein
VYGLRNMKIRHTRGLKKYIIDKGDIPVWDEDTMAITRKIFEIDD